MLHVWPAFLMIVWLKETLFLKLYLKVVCMALIIPRFMLSDLQMFSGLHLCMPENAFISLWIVSSLRKKGAILEFFNTPKYSLLHLNESNK